MIKHTRTVGKEYLAIKMKSSNWHGGKGSTPRINTNSKQYQDNWDKIFGKSKGCPVKDYIDDIKDQKIRYKDVSTTQVRSEETQQKT